MTPSFNLTDQPWIPCLHEDSQIVELGLQDTLLEAHHLREIYGESPLVTATLYRLLLAILHRVFGPHSTSAWHELWRNQQWPAQSLEDYFAHWRHRFDLFDIERPFYQADDARVKPISVINLVPQMSSGNNPTLFDHHTDAEGASLSPAEAARALVAAQAFSLGGTKGRTKDEYVTASPCAKGTLFIVEGKTLFETLALNLIRYPVEEISNSPELDRPSWEQDQPFVPDREVPFGYLDYLTWQSRRIRLSANHDGVTVFVCDITLAPGLHLADNVYDSMKHHIAAKEKGLFPLCFQEDRALWRDSAALFRLQQTTQSASQDRPPRALKWLSELVYSGLLDKEMVFRQIAFGMANDKAKILFYRHETMPLPLVYLQNESLVEGLSAALEKAEKTAGQLRGALFTFARLTLSSETDATVAVQPEPKDVGNLVEHWGTLRHYWGTLEVHFWTLLNTLPQQPEEAQSTWDSVLKRVAREAFERAEQLAGATPQALKGAVLARRTLETGLAKIFQE